MLISPMEDFQLPSLAKWERHLNCHLSSSKRQHILKFTHKSSLCSKIQETNYKILMRWYRTPDLLHTFFPEATDICWQCQKEKGTMLHIFWTCPGIKTYWTEVRRIVQKFRPSGSRRPSILPLALHQHPIRGQKVGGQTPTGRS